MLFIGGIVTIITVVSIGFKKFDDLFIEDDYYDRPYVW